MRVEWNPDDWEVVIKSSEPQVCPFCHGSPTAQTPWGEIVCPRCNGRGVDPECGWSSITLQHKSTPTPLDGKDRTVP